jgi:hypothetical protein
MCLAGVKVGIDAAKTAMEISKMLSKAGATAILTEYDKEEGYVSAISFRIPDSIGFRGS